jgi:dihydroorotase
MKNLNYEERLRKLKLPTLGYRRVRGDMIEMYKIIKGKYDKDVITLVKTAEQSEVRHSTKTNTEKIVQLRANKELRWIFLA